MNRKVKNHQLKLMALTDSGFVCPPNGGYFHLPVETGSIKIGRINKQDFLKKATFSAASMIIFGCKDS
jgi:hypothetical protein